MVTDTLKDRICSVLARIDTVAGRTGRSGKDITLIAVSKTHPLELILEAVRTGLISQLGENKVQEGQEKISRWPSDMTAKAAWHLIGHLQNNKARKALEYFDFIQSVDSEKLAASLQRILSESNHSMPVLMEVNCSGEAQKSGIPMDKAKELALFIAEKCPLLQFKGLMTVGPLGGNEQKIREAFSNTFKLKEQLTPVIGYPLPILSMGMSDDFEWAIEEGSTMVRIGTAIFGARKYPEQREAL